MTWIFKGGFSYCSELNWNSGPNYDLKPNLFAYELEFKVFNALEHILSEAVVPQPVTINFTVESKSFESVCKHAGITLSVNVRFFTRIKAMSFALVRDEYSGCTIISCVTNG